MFALGLVGSDEIAITHLPYENISHMIAYLKLHETPMQIYYYNVRKPRAIGLISTIRFN